MIALAYIEICLRDRLVIFHKQTTKKSVLFWAIHYFRQWMPTRRITEFQVLPSKVVGTFEMVLVVA